MRIDLNKATANILIPDEEVAARHQALEAAGGYRPPEILYQIATDRTVPYVQKERKRTRHRIRYSDVKNVPGYGQEAGRPAPCRSRTGREICTSSGSSVWSSLSQIPCTWS